MRLNKVRLFFISGLLLFLFKALPGYSHEIRPAYIEITEDSLGRVTVLWKQPVMGDVGVKLIPHLTAGWLEKLPTEVSSSSSFYIKQWTNIEDNKHKLEGQTVKIEGLDETITDVLMNITFADGKKIQQILNPHTTSYIIHAGNSSGLPVLDYLYLGIEHILEGFDHLLFVLGLILLVKKRSLLLKTITAFTVAHSITLSAAALGFIDIQPAVIEVVIALSIIFLGVELVRSRQGNEGLTVKYPWFISFSFGLLHGFGFAGALVNVGLPKNDIPLSLLLFNVGVEIGQLVFVVTVSLLVWGLSRFLKKLPEWTSYMPPYAIGSFAAFWFIERLFNIF